MLYANFLSSTSWKGLKLHSTIVLLCIAVFIDYDGDILNLAFLQYFFSEGEHKLKHASHGNALYNQPYILTMPSTL